MNFVSGSRHRYLLAALGWLLLAAFPSFAQDMQEPALLDAVVSQPQSQAQPQSQTQPQAEVQPAAQDHPGDQPDENGQSSKDSRKNKNDRMFS